MKFVIARSKRNLRAGTIALAVLAICLVSSAQSQNSIAKAVGTAKSVSGNVVVLTTDAGSDVTVNFADSARVMQMAPGQTDLKAATRIAVADIQIGDRVLARGSGGDGAAVVATSA